MALILAIDDKKNLLEAVATVLEEEHTCLLAENGRDAVESFRLNRPGVVLLDLILDGESGDDIAKAILDIDPDAHIVVFSVVSSAERVTDLFRIGIRDWIDKSCAPSELLEIVRKNLARPDAKPWVATPTLLRVRERVVRSFHAGRIPLVYGLSGQGKKTVMREALSQLAVKDAMVTELPMIQWRDRLRAPPATRPGMILHIRQSGLSTPWDEIDRLADKFEWKASAPEVPLLGIVLDVQQAGSDCGFPALGGDLDPVYLTPITKRPEEIGMILEGFRHGLPRPSPVRHQSDLDRCFLLMTVEPRLANMTWLRTLAEHPPLWNVFHDTTRHDR